MVLKFLGDVSRWTGGWPNVNKSSTGFGPCHVLVTCETRTLTFVLPWIRVSLVGTSGVWAQHLGFLWEATHPSPGPCAYESQGTSQVALVVKNPPASTIDMSHRFSP